MEEMSRMDTKRTAAALFCRCRNLSCISAVSPSLPTWVNGPFRFTNAAKISPLLVQLNLSQTSCHKSSCEKMLENIARASFNHMWKPSCV